METMLAVVHSRSAPLRMAHVPRPSPGPGEVLIDVVAAGVNRADLGQRQRSSGPPVQAAELLGLEVSGHVAETGAGVERWQVGDAVCALLPGGGYAEYCLAPAGSVLPVPEGLSLVEAAGLPEAVLTVWANVFDRGQLRPQETLLVHAGGSGVGTTAIQMGRAHGARVIATARRPEKCRVCEDLGAVRAVDTTVEDFVQIVGAMGGVDVVLDLVGGASVARNLSVLRELGRCVLVAAMDGFTAEIDLVPIMLNRLTLTGSTLRDRSVDEKARLATSVERVVWPWVAAGRVRPIVHEAFPLSEAERAHRLLGSNAVTGKLILLVDPSG